jgi:hypothetical protein
MRKRKEQPMPGHDKREKKIRFASRYRSLKKKETALLEELMFRNYREIYENTGRFADSLDDEIILMAIEDELSHLPVEISQEAVEREYMSRKETFRRRILSGQLKTICESLVIEPLKPVFTVCHVEDYSQIDIDQPYVFIGRTDLERSLVCPEELVPSNAFEKEEGWCCFRIKGQLDFSLVGILAEISSSLAYERISVFTVSTFDTDYIFVKQELYADALNVFILSGFTVSSQ